MVSCVEFGVGSRCGISSPVPSYGWAASLESRKGEEGGTTCNTDSVWVITKHECCIV